MKTILTALYYPIAFVAILITIVIGGFVGIAEYFYNYKLRGFRKTNMFWYYFFNNALTEYVDKKLTGIARFLKVYSELRDVLASLYLVFSWFLFIAVFVLLNLLYLTGNINPDDAGETIFSLIMASFVIANLALASVLFDRRCPKPCY